MLIKHYQLLVQKENVEAQMPDTKKLTPVQIKAIETVLSKGDRVEIIPQREGVKIVHIKRNEIKG